MQTITTPTPKELSEDHTTQAPADALAAVHRRSVDSAAGFKTMVDRAEPEFRATAERFLAMHTEHAAVLARILADRGVVADHDGSFMGTINKAVVTFRSLVDQIDADVMQQVRSGEDWVLEAFDTAIAALGDAPEVARLHDMRSELTELLAKTMKLG